MSTSIGELNGLVSLEDQFSGALEKVWHTTENLVSKIEDKFGGLAIGVTAVGAAVVGVAGTIIALGIKGSELNNLDAGFERLAGGAQNADSILKSLNKGVADTIDSTELLKFANQAMSRGAIKTAEDFGTVATAARVLSRDGFGPIPNIMNTISQAMSTGRAKGLQFLTGMIDLKKAEEDYAKSIGTTRDQLSASGRLHADQIAIMARLNEKIKEAGPIQKNFAEQFATAKNAVSDWFDNIAKAVAKSPAVTRAFDTIGDAIVKNFGGTASTAAETIVKWVEKFADGVSYYGPIVIEWVRKVIDGVQDIWEKVQHAWDLVPDWFKNIAKEAVIAGAAIKITKEMIGSISRGVAGTGNGLLGDLLGNTASGATIISGFQSIIALAPKVVSYVTNVKNAFALLFAELTFAFNTGGIVAVFEGIGIVIADIGAVVAASPFFVAALWVGIAAGAYEVGLAIRDLYKWWQDGKPMWDFFTRRDTNNFVRRAIGWGDEAPKPTAMANTFNMAGTVPMSQSPNKGNVAGVDIKAYIGDADPNEIAENLKKIEETTEASLEHTKSYWEDYNTTIASLTASAGEQKLQQNERWIQGEIDKLEKTKKYNKNFYDELFAIVAAGAAKEMSILQEITEKSIESSREMGAAAQDAIGKGFGGQNVLQTMSRVPLAPTSTVNPIGALISEKGVASANAIAAALDKTFKQQIRMTPETARMAQKMRDAGMSADQIAEALGISTGQAEKISKTFGDKFKDVMKGLGSGLNDVFVAAFEGGGGVGGAIKALGTQAIQGLMSLIPVVGPFVSQFAGAIVAGITRLTGGPSKKELEGRDVVKEFESQFSGTADMLAKLTDAFGGDAEKARQTALAMWDAEKNGAEATKKALEEVNAALAHHNEVLDTIRSEGFLSSDELQSAADKAKEAFDEMERSGKYTIEQLADAWTIYEKAQARATHDPAQEMADMAEAAGYETQEQMQKAADKAKELAEYMQKSGKYTAEAVEDAFDKASEAQAKALGMNTKAISELQSQIDGLTKGIEQEAPELDMGTIEKQMRQQRDDLEKQVAAQKDVFAHAGDGAADAAAKAGDAATAAADTAKRVWGDYTIDFGSKFRTTAEGMASDLVTSGEIGAKGISAAFDGFEIRVPVHFDYDKVEAPEPPVHPQAQGGIGHATGPMMFSTQGDEDWMFSGEGKSFSDMFASRQLVQKNITVVVQAGRKTLKEVLIDELDESPTLRDAKVLAGVQKAAN